MLELFAWYLIYTGVLLTSVLLLAVYSDYKELKKSREELHWPEYSFRSPMFWMLMLFSVLPVLNLTIPFLVIRALIRAKK